MKLLALDLGTSCGWCITDGTVFDSGIWDLSVGRYEGGGMRFLRFRERLASVLGNIDRVAYEEVRSHKGASAAHVYGGLQAVLTEECERRGIPYEALPVATIKRHATGIGNASKTAMVDAALEKWPGTDIRRPDQADALHIADLVVSRSSLI